MGVSFFFEGPDPFVEGRPRREHQEHRRPPFLGVSLRKKRASHTSPQAESANSALAGRLAIRARLELEGLQKRVAELKKEKARAAQKAKHLQRRETGIEGLGTGLRGYFVSGSWGWGWGRGFFQGVGVGVVWGLGLV